MFKCRIVAGSKRSRRVGVGADAGAGVGDSDLRVGGFTVAIRGTRLSCCVTLFEVCPMPHSARYYKNKKSKK